MANEGDRLKRVVSNEKTFQERLKERLGKIKKENDKTSKKG